MLNCSFAKDLYQSLRKSREERRTVYSPLLNFLKNPNKESEFDNNLDMTITKSKSCVLQTVLKKILCCSTSIIGSQMRERLQNGSEKNSMLLDFNNRISDEENPTSIAKMLFQSIEECKSLIKSISRVTDLDTQLSTEIDLVTSEGGRGEYL